MFRARPARHSWPTAVNMDHLNAVPPKRADRPLKLGTDSEPSPTVMMFEHHRLLFFSTRQTFCMALCPQGTEAPSCLLC